MFAFYGLYFQIINMKKLVFILSLALSVLTLDSCGPGRYTVTAQPSVPVYERPVSPGVGYVWVDGDWYRSGGRYVYRNGYWSRPRGHRTWAAGVWVRKGNGWYYKRGHWR